MGALPINWVKTDARLYSEASWAQFLCSLFWLGLCIAYYDTVWIEMSVLLSVLSAEFIWKPKESVTKTQGDLHSLPFGKQ